LVKINLKKDPNIKVKMVKSNSWTKAANLKRLLKNNINNAEIIWRRIQRVLKWKTKMETIELKIKIKYIKRDENIKIKPSKINLRAIKKMVAKFKIIKIKSWQNI